MKARLFRHTRHPLAGSIVVLACLIVGLSLALTACGGSSATETTAAASPTSVAGTGTSLSVDELGQTIASTWTKAMQDLDALLAGEPEAGTVKDKLTALKEQYVQQLVALGQQREALDGAGKTQVSSVVAAALSAAADTDWYAAYKDAYDHYSYAAGDVDFVNLVASFNILTQYADYDLLKSQDPKEAARLGIN